MNTANQIKNAIIILLGMLFCAGLYGQEENPAGWLGFALSDKTIAQTFVFGDLNNDNMDDCVIITKQTKKDAIIKNEDTGAIEDRNRRGLLIAFKDKGEYYSRALELVGCFDSAYDDLRMDIEIKDGNLIIHHDYGKYGMYQYTFRYRNNNFELIGFKHISKPVIVEKMVNIDFLTKTKQTLTNKNPNLYPDDPEYKGEEFDFEETNIVIVGNLVRLADMTIFSEFSANFTSETEAYYTESPAKTQGTNDGTTQSSKKVKYLFDNFGFFDDGTCVSDITIPNPKRDTYQEFPALLIVGKSTEWPLFDDNGKISRGWKIINHYRLYSSLQITNIEPETAKISAKDIQEIEEDRLIFITPENDYENWARHRNDRQGEFEKMGISAVDAKKRYLSFTLFDGEKIIIDAKKKQNGTNCSALLYRKGYIPIIIFISGGSDEDNEQVGYYFNAASQPFEFWRADREKPNSR